VIIALVGMPGSGKSTVGRHLARQLGRPFVDTDAAIEQRIGSTIVDWFARHGEAAFRDVEQEVVAELTRDDGTVLATGGGVVLRPANREALHERCQVFYLRASPDELHRRLRHDTHRPLLQVDNPQRRLREMFRERDPLYRRTAHYVIETPRPSVPALLNMVLMQLELGGWIDPAQLPSSIGADKPAA
jgi:shikimate kinase